MSASTKNIVVFGSGYIVEEYLKVLKKLNAQVTVIGRSEEKARILANHYGYIGFGGGIETFKKLDTSKTDWVINAASIESLTEINLACLQKGIVNLLVEKPGALTLGEFRQVKSKVKPKVNVRFAHNRRFYNSVLLLEKKIKEDGGVEGCFFDFTDREKDILGSKRTPEVLKHWGWSNAVHVIDLAFFFIGLPEKINVYRSGGWDFHPNGQTFVGSGKSSKSLFSYFATWAGGGRWNVEISTKNARYKLSPLEELKVCKKNQFEWENVTLADEDDHKFKPGFYKMIKNVLDHKLERLPDIDQQIKLGKVLNNIYGYEN